MVLLCNPDGVAIHHRGDEARADEFKDWGIWVGGVWSEQIEGTNGIGTCITEQRPVLVHCGQHYRTRHSNLTCAGCAHLRCLRQAGRRAGRFSRGRGLGSNATVSFGRNHGVCAGGRGAAFSGVLPATRGSSPRCRRTKAGRRCFSPWMKISASWARIEWRRLAFSLSDRSLAEGSNFPRSSITGVCFSAGALGRTFRFG